MFYFECLGSPCLRAMEEVGRPAYVRRMTVLTFILLLQVKGAVGTFITVAQLIMNRSSGLSSGFALY